MFGAAAVMDTGPAVVQVAKMKSARAAGEAAAKHNNRGMDVRTIGVIVVRQPEEIK